MQRIELDNFRVFGAPASFDLAPVTVLTGKNNSGKSSLIKAFLVLADYLEQDDQTVLRLDGPRATRHRISEWQNLENWESSEYGNVTLSHTQGDTQFIYEFQDSGSRRPANLFRFRMIIPDIGELLFKSVSGGVYQLEVAQKFINYVVGSAEEKSKIREAASYPTRLNTLRRELADLNRKFHQANSSSTVAEDYTQLVQQRQELQNTVSNLEALVVKTKSVSGIFFQTEIWSDSISRRSLSGLIQAALMKYIAGEEDDDVEDQEEDGPVAADYDPDLLDDEYWESQREQARYERETKEINESSQSSQQHFVTLNTEEERRILIQFPQAVDQQMRFTIAHSGANRTYQARLYLTGTHHSEINTIAENFQRQGVYAEGSAAAFLEYWLPQFEIGQKIRIQLVENAAIRIEVIKGNKRINLADLGFGAGQILTILLQLATLIQARDEQLLIVNKSRDLPTIALIEEPEANLHPQFQSRLAELFAEAAHRYGLQFVIETHSEYFIRNIQVLVKEQQRINQFKVYYLDAPSEANGHKHGHEMRLREDGVFMDEFGEGFLMNESANLTFKLF